MANASRWEDNDRQRHRHDDDNDRRYGAQRPEDDERDMRRSQGGYGEERYGGNYGNPSRYGDRSRSGGQSGYAPYAPEQADESGFRQGQRGGAMSTGNDNQWERRAYGSQQQSGPHRGSGPKGYTRLDERIREDVCDALTEAAHLDASSIDVTVKDCEVTLAGTVSSRHDKREAEDMAERCSGVKNVQNNLKVEQNASSMSALGMGSSTSSTTPRQ